MQCLRPSQWNFIFKLFFILWNNYYVDAGYEPIQGSEEDINFDILKSEPRYLDQDGTASGDSQISQSDNDHSLNADNRENLDENFFESQRRSVLPLPRGLGNPSGQKVVNYQALLDHETKIRRGQPKAWVPSLTYVPVTANSLMKASRASKPRDDRFRQYIISLNKILKRNALRLENEIILRDAIVRAMLQPPSNLYDKILHDPFGAMEATGAEDFDSERDVNPFLQRYQKMKLNAMLKRKQVHPLNKFRGAPFTGDRRFWAPTEVNSMIAKRQQQRMLLDKKKHLYLARKRFMDAVKRYNDIRRFREMSMLQRQANERAAQRRNKSGHQVHSSGNVARTPMLRGLTAQQAYKAYHANSQETMKHKNLLQRAAPKVTNNGKKDLEKEQFINQTRALSRINTAKLLATALQRIHSRLSTLKKGTTKSSAPSLVKMQKLIKELNSHNGHGKLPRFQPLMQAINESLKAKDKIKITEIPFTRSLSSLGKLKALMHHDSPPTFISLPKGSGDVHLKLVSADQSNTNCRTLNNESQVVIIQSPQFENLKVNKDINCRNGVPVPSSKAIKNTATRNYTTDDSIIKMALRQSKDNKTAQHLLFSKLPNITSMLPIKNIALPKQVLQETLDRFGKNKAPIKALNGMAGQNHLKTQNDRAAKVSLQAPDKNHAPNLSKPSKTSAHSKTKITSSTKDLYPKPLRAKSRPHSSRRNKPLPNKVKQSLKFKAQKQYQNSQIVKEKEPNRILSAPKEHDLSNLQIKASADFMTSSSGPDKKQGKSNRKATKREKQILSIKAKADKPSSSFTKTKKIKHLSLASKRVLNQLRINRGGKKHIQKNIHSISEGDKKSNVGNASQLHGRETQKLPSVSGSAPHGTNRLVKGNNKLSQSNIKSNLSQGIAATPSNKSLVNSSKITSGVERKINQFPNKPSSNIDSPVASSKKPSPSGNFVAFAVAPTARTSPNAVPGSRRTKGPDVVSEIHNQIKRFKSDNSQIASSDSKASTMNKLIVPSTSLDSKGENNTDPTIRHEIPVQESDLHLVRSSETDDLHDPSAYAASLHESKLSMRHNMERGPEERGPANKKSQSEETDQEQQETQDQVVKEPAESQQKDDIDAMKLDSDDSNKDESDSETKNFGVDESNSQISTESFSDASKSDAVPSLSYFENSEDQSEGMADALPLAEEGSDDELSLKANQNHRHTSLSRHHHRHHHQPHKHHHHGHHGYNQGIRKHKVSSRHLLRHQRRFHRNEETIR